MWDNRQFFKSLQYPCQTAKEEYDLVLNEKNIQRIVLGQNYLKK